MPSANARQRNKRALESTGGVSRAPAGKGKAKGRGAGEPYKLQSLLYILLATTILLVAYQLARFYYRGHVALSPLSAWTKTKYGAHDRANQVVDNGRTKFNKLAPEGAIPGAPALVPGQEATDSLDELRKKLGLEGELESQFDEDGNLDLATIQRMLDILYKPARDGVKGAARAAGHVLEAMTEDEVAVDAADAAEVADEATP
ncbi:hypothetical protein PSEUBRA_000036 [Kalmanozyma brasiliensis GHG001]|uniref:Uncharacterized protein n=1 Tax=Kalmanozyma brasiliensis (strain GHG001) TaxID=1365824 RepID=V5F2L2_KALBG|nr:uncharacterized protein PSEUBRA_000036 [Kalmanozyma brasiliensis GHG001]EST09664.1 hypothetical protein PSEUBRA_000036 [Kalmanozyma brasiliensis GHG001]